MQYPIIHTMEQGSDEWFAIRLGKISASNFKVAIGKPSATRSLLMRKLIGEIRSGKRQQSLKTFYMEKGTELEPYARFEYEKYNACEVQQVGFVEMNEQTGCSPDGLVGPDGGLQIKCPIISTHIKYIHDKILPTDYVPQVYGELGVTGRKWWDFISYCPDDLDMPYWSIRIVRDEKYIAEIMVKIKKFLDEMKQYMEELKPLAF